MASKRSLEEHLISNKEEKAKIQNNHLRAVQKKGLKNWRSKNQNIFFAWRVGIEVQSSEEISLLAGTKYFSNLREGDASKLLVEKLKTNLNFHFIH